MKKPVAYLLIVVVLSFVFQAFVIKPTLNPGIPDDVQEILKTSCYDCHSNQASSDKSKEALNFDEWNDYKISKKISKLGDFCELVDEGKMPPEKYLKSKPEKNLSDSQKKLICDWAEKESLHLLEGN